ncbi:hypothetical protein M758_12G161600 [Ceratodon purpureus]|uniref:Uncharacterized protein n=1 Tax=Ceratodon purpureus TaxID=3225 RepID=A0A8T0G7R6_CERPU|nr:hypothetical protein KC19_12G158800 [Ceratodon purpureus]KAG0599560.1 hypothetical protein M758_12G161600 [Ceratodon purpureus]
MKNIVSAFWARCIVFELSTFEILGGVFWSDSGATLVQPEFLVQEGFYRTRLHEGFRFFSQVLTKP